MTETTTQKSDRIYLRTTRQQKDVLQKAAGLRRQQTTEFVLNASLAAAEAVLENEEQLLLSERDFAHFVQLIENPPAPTPALRVAMSEYRRLQAAHPDSNL